jgi:DNA-directed RNA polymerase beta subunit
MVHASTGEIMVKGNVSQSINSETSFMLPLMVMFRLLGIETDEDIIDAVRSNGRKSGR